MLGIARQLTLNPKVYLASRCDAGVRGPHRGKRLANAAYGIFHGSRADLSTTGGNSAAAVSVHKDLEKWDWILDVLKGRVQSEGSAEGCPEVPVTKGCIGS